MKKEYSIAKLMIVVGLFSFCTAIFGQATQAGVKTSPSVQSNSPVGAAFTYKIIEAANHTYGYDIFADGKLKIHQTRIPTLAGNNGFATKEDAGKAAELVMSKMKNGQNPPTFTLAELKGLKVATK